MASWLWLIATPRKDGDRFILSSFYSLKKQKNEKQFAQGQNFARLSNYED